MESIRFIAIFLLFALLNCSSAAATTINVPKDQPTIQAGINVATAGDTVLVSPGTYLENIDFIGKAIVVISAGGPTATVIDGGKLTQVVTFESGELSTSVLSGFTIQNGAPVNVFDAAGGISILNSSPTIIHNVVTKNFGCGIGVYYGAPIIKNNTISYTSGDGCNPAGGSGILLYGQGTQFGMGSVQIVGNVIVHNVSFEQDGAGIYLWIAGAPLIENNIIAFNQTGSSGGGITMQNTGNPLIIQNLIAGNAAGTFGGGLDLEIPSDGSNATLVNNTIAGNTIANGLDGPGPQVYVSGFFGTVAFWNNIIVGLTNSPVVYCDPLYGAPSPLFDHNDAFSPKGGDYAGTCAGETGQHGNISANPKFVAKRNLELKAGSPAVNTGSNSAPNLPGKDLAGHPRIAGGIIDIGAYEHQGGASFLSKR